MAWSVRFGKSHLLRSGRWGCRNLRVRSGSARTSPDAMMAWHHQMTVVLQQWMYLTKQGKRGHLELLSSNRRVACNRDAPRSVHSSVQLPDRVRARNAAIRTLARALRSPTPTTSLSESIPIPTPPACKFLYLFQSNHFNIANCLQKHRASFSYSNAD
jgi:hypothetical protein